MSGPNLVTALFVFYNGENQELRDEALNTLRTLPAQILLAALAEPELHFAIIDLIVRLRYRDELVMEAAMVHPMVGIKSLLFLAEHSSGGVLDRLSHNDQLLRQAAVLREIICNNPHADRAMKLRLGWVEPSPEVVEPQPEEAEPDSEEEESTEEEDWSEEELSKYQQIEHMSVADKIKMAMTGDKEWRTLLLREANKQVNTAVLKNPRITEKEVITIVKNRSSNEDLIREILRNRDWVKIYEVKKALVYHPRTPLQTAMRYMNFLAERDVRDLAKSREVNHAIVNNARRIVAGKN